MSRRGLATLALVLLAATSGCTTIFGPGNVDETALAEDPQPEYDWDTEVDGFLHLNRNNYTAVYDVANRTSGDLDAQNPTFEIYQRDALGREDPVEISALQFRYPNGTTLRYEETDDGAEVVRVGPNGSSSSAPDALAVETSQTRTVVSLPTNESGKLAFTAPRNGKSLSTPTFVQGSYEMSIPERGEVAIPLLAQVRPPADRTATDAAGRVHIHWDEVDSRNLAVRYYLGRDLLIFSGIVVLLTTVGIIGSVYYLLQIRETKKRREEVGLDVDVPEDDRDGPPPGMR
jgi:hypothetical protein